ncbi:hypothetical protein [Sphingomonas oryzagri]
MTTVVQFAAQDRAEAWQERRSTLQDQAFPTRNMLATLNGHCFTGAQMRAAVDAIAHIQVRGPADIVEHARLLRTFAVRQGLDVSDPAIESLHGRIVAMDRWCALHDPHGQSDVDAFFEAAGRQPLVATAEGLGFDARSFRELIDFIVEMPF